MPRCHRKSQDTNFKWQAYFTLFTSNGISREMDLPGPTLGFASFC